MSSNLYDSSSLLKPALTLGSGFHRHVFGDTANSAVRPLYNWHYLIGQVAASMQVAIPDTVMSTVQRWNTLVLRAAQEGFRDHAGRRCAPLLRQAHFIEKEARRCVAAVLNEAAAQYPQSSRARMPLADCWGAVIYLNFDGAWLPESSKLKPRGFEAKNFPITIINHREKRRLTASVLIPCVDGGAHRRVWFPNGTCAAHETIRMGLHDYGVAAHAVIHGAFSHLKRWEREQSVSGKSPGEQLAACTAALRHASEGVNDLSELLGVRPLPLTWVADFLYRPLIFAGVGMSDQETGLWWLLAQRARNFARAGAPSNAFILLDAYDRPAFWRTRPFGLVPIVCSNWDEGWEKVLTKATELA